MQGLRRPRAAIIQREIQYLTRAFPPRAVRVTREIVPYTTSKGQRIPNTPGQGISKTVFIGEAIYIPAGGVVQLFGGGQVERTSPTLVIVGDRDIQQGDFVALDGRTYQVELALNPQGGYVELRLQQFKQAV